MQRRSVLKAGLGATLGATTGCLPQFLAPARISQSELDKIFARLDGGLEKISRYDMLGDFGSSAKSAFGDGELCTKALRTLYTSATFRSLPEEVQLHPSMQQRVYAQLDEMDDAVFGMTSMLADVPADRRTAVKHALARDPEIPERISEAIDLRAGKIQLALGRRLQMRSIFKQVGWRMQHQSPSVVIDEYVTKVNKVQGQIGSHAELQRRLAAQIGNDAYWRHQQRLARADDPGTGGGPPGATLSPAPSAPQAPAPRLEHLTTQARMAAREGLCQTVATLARETYQLDREYYGKVFLEDPGIATCLKVAEREVLRQPAPGAPKPAGDSKKEAGSIIKGTGGWMMGIGLVTGLGGILLVGANSTAVIGAIGLTIGAALLIGGLIVYIVGASTG